jgi:hypothetical protein
MILTFICQKFPFEVRFKALVTKLPYKELDKITSDLHSKMLEYATEHFYNEENTGPEEAGNAFGKPFNPIWVHQIVKFHSNSTILMLIQ